MLQDALLFRGALREPFMNAHLRMGQEAHHVRWRSGEDGLQTLAGPPANWDPADDTLPMEQRMVAALLSTSSLERAVADLGFRLAVESLGVDVFEEDDPDVLVRRIGGPHAWVALESGTSRPRMIGISTGGQDYVAVAQAYGEAGAGWLPTQVVVRSNQGALLELSITDAGPLTTDLAPLDDVQSEGPEPRPRRRFPRLPL